MQILWPVHEGLASVQGSCPAALVRSSSLTGLAGRKNRKGLGGNLRGIQVIAFSVVTLSLQVAAVVDLDRGQSFPETSRADVSQRNAEVQGLLCRGSLPPFALQTMQTACER